MSSSTSEIAFLPLGAILQTLPISGHNIVLGFASQADYEAHNNPHFGATIGRVANRLANAKITSLNNGQSYPLAANNGPNSLHGGPRGWGKRVWDGPAPVGVRKEIAPGWEEGKLEQGGESVRFSLVSKDGDEGFPGEVKASVVYTAGTRTEGGKEVTVLGMEYEAELTGGAEETVVNMTNHSYFNLSPAPTITGTQITLATTTHLPVDATGIPSTTTPAPYPGLEPQTSFTLGATAPDVDDCFVFPSDTTTIDTRALPLRKLVAAHHPDSGIHLEVWSTEPAFQFYTGKYVDVPAVGGAPARGARAGFCVEPSRFVNAVNVDEWRAQTVLKKGETYGARIVYRAWKD